MSEDVLDEQRIRPLDSNKNAVFLLNFEAFQGLHKHLFKVHISSRLYASPIRKS
jgi:hypothetical protein